MIKNRTHISSVPFLSREEIESKARDVLRHHKLETIPINPVIIAQKEGFRVNNAKFSEENLSGIVAKRGDNLIILVHADDTPNRKRFTISHEIAHHFLHLANDGEFVDGEADLFREDFGEDTEENPSNHRAEIQANIFAAALLMPEEQVRNIWKLTQSVSKMSRLFGVSEESMGYRLDRLGISIGE